MGEGGARSEIEVGDGGRRWRSKVGARVGVVNDSGMETREMKRKYWACVDYMMEIYKS